MGWEGWIGLSWLDFEGQRGKGGMMGFLLGILVDDGDKNEGCVLLIVVLVTPFFHFFRFSFSCFISVLLLGQCFSIFGLFS